MVSHPKLVEPLVVQRAELTRQPTEVPDERRLDVGAIDVVAECRPSAELQANFGFLLRLDQRLARQQKVGDELAAARYGREAIAGLVGDVEGREYEPATTRDGSRPW